MRREKTTKKLQRFGIVWFFLRQYRIYFLFLIALAFLIGLLEALNVAIIYPILSYGLNTEAAGNQILNFLSIFIRFIPFNDELVQYSILFIILASLVVVIKISYIFFSAKIMSKIVIGIKQEIFHKCISSDYQFFIDNKQGEILYKTSTAPNNIAALISILSNSFVEILLSISVFTLLLSMSLPGTLLIVGGGILYYLINKQLSVKIHYKTGKQQLESGQTETVVINEFTSGIKQIKVFDTFTYWKNLYDKALTSYWQSYRKGHFWQFAPEVLLTFLMYLSIGVLIIYVKLYYPASFIPMIPVIGTFAFALFRIMPKLSNFGKLRMQFMNILPNVEAVYDMVHDTSYGTIKNGEKEFTGLRSGIEFRNVKFAYKARDILLDNVSFDIKKDRVTAMVGPSGSGKSTIVNLMLRLHDVKNGGVFIDNINIKNFDVFSFLPKVGFVSQDTFIYNASVRDNIAFGNSFSDEEIIEAARMANAHDFIQELPEQYHTVVGDRGIKLSGGEKQRIAIARAMIRKPEILILDEATSSLDNIAESAVQKAINIISKNCTTFVVAHRLSTIQNADHIYVLDQGKIIEQGKHRELISQKGKYWELYNIQKT